jgi:hypothetical protein
MDVVVLDNHASRWIYCIVDVVYRIVLYQDTWLKYIEAHDPSTAPAIGGVDVVEAAYRVVAGASAKLCHEHNSVWNLGRTYCDGGASYDVVVKVDSEFGSIAHDAVPSKVIDSAVCNFYRDGVDSSAQIYSVGAIGIPCRLDVVHIYVQYPPRRLTIQYASEPCCSRW